MPWLTRLVETRLDTLSERPSPPAARRSLYLIVLTALATRALYLLEYRHSIFFDFFRNDQLYYRTWGLQIASGDPGGGQAFSQGPLYAYFLGALFRLLGPAETPVLVLQQFCGLVTVALVFWCARRLWDSRSAALAGLLAALYGPLIFYECMIMKTFLEPLLVIAALAAGLRVLEDGRARWCVAAGAAVGLACLVRESHLLLLAPLCAAAAHANSAQTPSTPRRLNRVAIVLGAFLLTLAPATLHNWRAAREFIPVTTGGGQNLYLGFGPTATGYYTSPGFDSRVAYQEHEDFRLEAFLRTGRRLSPGESSRFWFGEALRAMREAPRRTVELLAWKALMLFNDYERPDNEDFEVTRAEVRLLDFLPTFGWVAGLGLLGLCWALSGGGRAWLPAGFAAALVLEVLLTFNLGRYRAGLAVIWLLFAGRGLAGLSAAVFRGKSPGRGGRLALLAAAVLLTALAFRTPPRATRSFIAADHDLFRRQVAGSAVVRDTIGPLRRALAARPGDPALLEELALALDTTGKVYEALPIFEEVLRLDPDARAARARLADIYAKLGNPERAAGHARLLVHRRPDDPWIRVLLGKLLVQQALHAADDASARRLLGEAAASVQRALALDPSLAEARAWSEKLDRLSRTYGR